MSENLDIREIPGGSLLGRTFSETFELDDDLRVVVSGHGTYLNTTIVHLREPSCDSPCSCDDYCENALCRGLGTGFVELNVFPSVPKVIRGLIPLIEDDTVLVYADDCIALVGMQKLLEGGVVCHSRVLAIHNVVGGVRVDRNTVHMVFSNGGMEDVRFVFREEAVFTEIIKSRSQTIIFRHGFATAFRRVGEMDLIASSHGFVLNLTTGHFLMQFNYRAAISSMLCVDRMSVLVLYADGTIGLAKIGGTAEMTLVPGRFSSIAKTGPFTFVAGDHEGRVHRFVLSLGGDKLSFVNARFVGIPGELTTLLSFKIEDRLYLFVGSRLGTLYCIDWMPTEVPLTHWDQKQMLLFDRITQPGFKAFVVFPECLFILKNGNILRFASCDHVKDTNRCQPILSGQVRNLKCQTTNGYQVAYGFGENCFWINQVEEDGNEKPLCGLMDSTQTILALIPMVPHRFILQCRSKIELWTFTEKREKSEAKVYLKFADKSATSILTAAAQVQSETRDCDCCIDSCSYFYSIVVGDSEGNVYFSHIEPKSTTCKLLLHEAATSATAGQRVVSAVSEGCQVLLLTAGGRILQMKLIHDQIMTVFGVPSRNVKDVQRLVLGRTCEYEKQVGSAYELMVLHGRFIIVGFKQREVIMLDFVTNLELFRVHAGSPRRCWHVALRQNYSVDLDQDENVIDFYYEEARKIVCKSVRVPHKPATVFLSGLRGRATASVLLPGIVTQAYLVGDCFGYYSLYSWDSGKMRFCDSRRDQSKSAVTCMETTGIYDDGFIIVAGNSTGTFTVFTVGRGNYGTISELGVLSSKEKRPLRHISFLTPVVRNLSQPTLVAACVEGGTLEIFSLRWDKDSLTDAFLLYASQRVISIDSFKTDVISCRAMNFNKDKDLMTILVLDAQGSLTSLELKRKGARVTKKSTVTSEKKLYSHLLIGLFHFKCVPDNFLICAGFDGSVLIYIYKDTNAQFACANSDRLHAAPIVDISYNTSILIDGNGMCNILGVVSLDSAGLVVYRRCYYENRRWTFDPKPQIFYSCVPRPRSVYTVSKRNVIVVAGEGIQLLPIHVA